MDTENTGLPACLLKKDADKHFWKNCIPTLIIIKNAITLFERRGFYECL